MNIGKQSSDLCSSSISQHFVGAYFDSGPWQDYVHSLIEIYRRRRDVMLDSLAEHFPREAEWTHPEGGLFIWATLPDYIDTTDLLARALEEHVAFVPGRAAFVDGRGGSLDATELLGRRRGRDPRGRPADRRGRARAGRPVRHADRRVQARRAAPRRARRPSGPQLDQTGETQPGSAEGAPPDPELGKILKLPAQRSRAG